MVTLDTLTAEQHAFWNERGFLHLPGFYSPAQIDDLDAVTDWMWREKPRDVTVDDTATARRVQLCACEGPERTRYRLNDLYLLSDTVRRTALDPRMVPILCSLLGDSPVLCNTRTLETGTAQPMHVDTLFMTPQTDDALIATWIAVEDVLPENGPLFYVPASHALPPYRFSTGSQHCVPEEMSLWTNAIEAGIAERGLRREQLLARRGDAFIWHARLVHGGAPIINPVGTRKSLVSHFYSRGDCEWMGASVLRAGAGLWLNRPPQAVAEAGIPPARRGSIDDWPASSGKVTGSIDGVQVERNALIVRGWAYELRSPGRVLAVAARADGLRYDARIGLARPDLPAVLHEPGTAVAGFELRIGLDNLDRSRNHLTVDAKLDDGRVLTVGVAQLPPRPQ
ncbi:MAG TPA: phytanoyl-CoA dioxygenase family protein [Candidatus Sulfotelmatobacter sp.]|nr:phytanoyl-CoA dioxygenase family protein [Candidatus Sulfotelmatobacter sp.]